MKKQKVIILYGLGYIGSVIAACMPNFWNKNKDYKLICLDKNKEKIDSFNKKVIPIFEPNLQNIFEENYSKGIYEFLTDYEFEKKIVIKDDSLFFNDLQIDIDYILIAVGTPYDEKLNEVNLNFVYSVFDNIKNILSCVKNKPTLILRSTVPPDSFNNIKEKLHEINDGDYNLIHHPEFLREGKAVEDYSYPEQLVFGLMNKSVLGDYNEYEIILDLYEHFNNSSTKIIFTDFNVSSSIKYLNNSFHALKVVYANEVARFLRKKNLNVQQMNEVFELFIDNKSLNICEKYLLPGSPFGGSCLPKELQAMKEIQFFDNIYLHNEDMIDIFYETIMEFYINQYWEKKKVAFVGLTFKYNTDDKRNSPNLILFEKLKRNDFLKDKIFSFNDQSEITDIQEYGFIIFSFNQDIKNLYLRNLVLDKKFKAISLDILYKDIFYKVLKNKIDFYNIWELIK